nr:flagellar basal-body MS-ring/collar protein FliF [Paenibacillus turpanensis]
MLRYRDRLTQYWKQITTVQKVMLISIAAMTVLTIALTLFYFTKTEYSNAFTDLNPTDAASIKTYLEQSNIPYKLSADGKTIGVPTKMVASVKLDVESQGLLKNGSIGFGLFRDNLSSFGMTDSEFNLLSTDARAGEIQKLINQIGGVSSSKVLLNVPDQGPYIRTAANEVASTASVVVSFKPGYSVDQAKIDTIYSLVAKSVPNLNIDNITVSDQNGELQPSSKQGGGIGGAANALEAQLKVRKTFELDLQKNVQNFLSTMFSRDKVIVSVFSTLNFDQKTSDQTIYSPVVDNRGIERSKQETQRSSTSSGGENGGIVGTGDTDVPNYPGAAATGASSSEEIQRTINYEINQVKSQIVSSPFVVKDLAISVGIEPPDPNDPNSLTPETREFVQNMLVSFVSTALADSGAGYTNEQLQNKVTVIPRSFDGKTGVTEQNGLSNAMLWGIGAAALALVGGGAYFIASRRRKTAEAAVAAAEAAAAEEAQRSDIPSIDLEAVSNENQMRKQLEELANRKPKEFVDLLRTWLVDE